MLKLTLVARTIDSLPLAASMDDEKEMKEIEQYKKQQKQILKQISSSSQPPKHLTVESGEYSFHILTDSGVSYMTLCEKAYSTQLAYSFLEDLKKEFVQLHGSEVDKVERPYAFIKFDVFIQKTKRVYNDQRTKRNYQKLREELNEVQEIVRKNIKDVIDRGKKLDELTTMSDDILAGAQSLHDNAKAINKRYWWTTYGPAVVVIAIVMLVLLIRWFFW